MEPENLIQETEIKESCTCKCCKCCKWAATAVIALLVIAVIVLYVLFFNSKGGSQATAPVATDGTQLPIAYVTMDSILTNYNLYNQMKDDLIREQESARAKINQKANALQADAADFQNKYQNNAFLSQERAQSEYERIARKQQELEAEDARLSQELVNKQALMMQTILSKIDSVVEVYNQDKGYHFIFTNTGNDNILYGNPGYDITNDILELLNQ